MLKEIYYEKNGKQIGPISLVEVEQLRISSETLVWFEGLANWKKASQIPELSSYLKATPPPLLSKKHIFANDKYDLTYERETNASISGFIYLIAQMFFSFISYRKIENEQPDFWYFAIIAAISLLYRFFITTWVISIAKRQNRDTSGWALFAFFLPTLSLILIGFLKRLKGFQTFAELQNQKNSP